MQNYSYFMSIKALVMLYVLSCFFLGALGISWCYCVSCTLCKI